MKAPNLNRQLVLENEDRVPDLAGGFSVAWQALGTLWAQMKPGSGRGRAGVAMQLSRVPYRIVVRGAPETSTARPKAGQRFRDGSRMFHITAVTEYDPEGRFLTCHAEEEVAA